MFLFGAGQVRLEFRVGVQSCDNGCGDELATYHVARVMHRTDNPTFAILLTASE
jgi:hypothetical protein